jgi:hypothetical protein
MFAAPEFADMFVNPSGADKIGGIVDVFKALALSPNPLDVLSVMAKTVVEIRGDVDIFLDRHGCEGPMTRRFAENLLRVNRGRPALAPVID